MGMKLSFKTDSSPYGRVFGKKIIYLALFYPEFDLASIVNQANVEGGSP